MKNLEFLNKILELLNKILEFLNKILEFLNKILEFLSKKYPLTLGQRMRSKKTSSCEAKTREF